jgi:hypothetical protein
VGRVMGWRNSNDGSIIKADHVSGSAVAAMFGEELVELFKFQSYSQESSPVKSNMQPRTWRQRL